MDVFFIFINIVALLALIGLLIWMQKRHFSFSQRVFTGLGLGIVLGAVLQMIYGADSEVLNGTTEWYNIVGSGYIQFLMMIVIPLVMVSIIQSIINLERTSQLGKMSGWIIGILIGTTMVAALIGIGTATVFDLNADQIEMGQEEMDRGTDLESTLTEVEEQSTPERILSFIPSNIFLDMTGDRPTWYCTPKVREKNLILGVFCMSIYDFEFKLKVVKDYLKGNLGYSLLAKKYGMPSKSPIVDRVRFYKEFGGEGLHRKHSKKVYPVQFKLDVLNFKKQTGASYADTASAFKMNNPSMIAKWQRKLLEEGIEGLLEKPKGRPSMSKKHQPKQRAQDNGLSREELLERENEILRLEVAYLKKLKAFQKDPDAFLEKHKQRWHSNSKKKDSN